MVWQVDGSALRRAALPDFTNYAHHFKFSLIPLYELWVDSGATGKDLEYDVERMVDEWRLISSGKRYAEAFEIASDRDRERRSELPRAAKIRLLFATNAGLKVWLVRGDEVRKVAPDYTEGGHDLVYPYIPTGDVWIDNAMEAGERGYTILHELTERAEMAQGMDYDHAHEVALRAEMDAREDPATLFPELLRLRSEAGSLFKALPVGTVREWAGKKFRKMAEGVWRPEKRWERKEKELDEGAVKERGQEVGKKEGFLNRALSSLQKHKESVGRAFDHAIEHAEGKWGKLGKMLGSAVRGQAYVPQMMKGGTAQIKAVVENARRLQKLKDGGEPLTEGEEKFLKAAKGEYAKALVYAASFAADFAASHAAGAALGSVLPTGVKALRHGAMFFGLATAAVTAVMEHVFKVTPPISALPADKRDELMRLGGLKADADSELHEMVFRDLSNVLMRLYAPKEARP